MPRASYCVPRCPRTFWDILTRGLKSQLGHRGISPDIPVNCCISKQSHVQHILLCPRMSRDILGLPSKKYVVPARTSRDIQGHPSQLVYIQTIPHPAYPILSHTIPEHPNKRYAVPARTSRDIPGHPTQLVYIQTIPCQGHPIVSWDILIRGMQSQLGHPGISQDIPVNWCISKHSHIHSHILGDQAIAPLTALQCILLRLNEVYFLILHNNNSNYTVSKQTNTKY